LLRDANLPPDVLVTVSRVDTTANLKSTLIWLYVLPDTRGEEVLKLLTPQLYDLQGAFNRAVEMQPLPRLRLRLDHGAEHADTINRRLTDLEKNDDSADA